MKELEGEALSKRQYDEAFRRHADRSNESLKNLSKFNVADSRQESGVKPMGTQSVRLVVSAERDHPTVLWILSKLERHNLPQMPDAQSPIAAYPRELFALGFAILWRGCLSSAALAKGRLCNVWHRK